MFNERFSYRKNWRVSIIEDDLSLCTVLKKVLSDSGYKVQQIYHSGEEFLKNISIDKPDVILMDIMLEGRLNGIETASMAKQILNAPVIFMTANNDDKIFLEAVKEDPFAYIVKPFHEKELERSIQLSLFKHHTEAGMLSNREWLQKILMSIGDGVITADKNGIVTFINPIAEALTKYPSKKALGMHMNDIFKIEHENGSLISNPFKRVIDEGIIIHLENQIVLTDMNGCKKPISDSGAPIRGADGEVNGVVIIFKDNSVQEEMKRSIIETTHKIERMEKQNRMTLNSLNEGVVVVDVDSYIIFANPAVMKITGLEKEKIIGYNAFEVFNLISVNICE